MTKYIKVAQPSISKEAAGELESLQLHYSEKSEILKAAHEGKVGALKRLAEEDPDTLMSAIVNGFTVKKTPHEEIADYYFEAQKNMSIIGEDYEGTVNYQYELGKTEAVEFVLKELGLQVLGVNLDIVE
ncbi:hypothetical protein [Rossellomorea marisflavi]|uniref:hypothetical protein n=1 Tax=Rossellomorea marisflavi TaxID=189381 RepID=UPI0009A85B12|nr:hypothetical protein [Rossellomorea marisflavi]